MLFYVLDHTYASLGILDSFRSATWITRFQDTGEFTLVLPTTRENVELLQMKRYLMCKGEPYYMVIEGRDSEWEWKLGDTFTITGRDLSSILERRHIYEQIDVKQNEEDEDTPVQDVIERILNENVINPANPKRKIPGFVFKRSTDPRITKLMMGKAQYLGEVVLDTIIKICQEYEIGFRVLPINNGGYEFSLYAGTDRSYEQDVNPWVTFSDSYENIGKTGFTENIKNYRNAMLVHYEREAKGRIVDAQGEPTGSYVDEKTVIEESIYEGSEPSGLDRFETWMSSSKSDKHEDGSAMEEEEFREILREQGREELSDYQIDTVFTGKIDDNKQFNYGRDFTLGDIVQMENKYGLQQAVRVAEIVRTHDSTGDHTTPSFVNLPDK